MNGDKQVTSIRSHSSPNVKKHLIFTFILAVVCDHVCVK
jgi:hypothetical protein